MAIITDTINLLHDKVLVKYMEFGEQVTASGIIIQNDNGKSEGIKPRWAQVWAIGPEQTDVNVGDWVLIEHGRWTRGFEVQDQDGSTITVRMIELSAMLCLADERPNDVYIGESAPSTSESYDFSTPMV